MNKKIYFRSTKHNNVDRVCVKFEESMQTSKVETSFGVFTMQNAGMGNGELFNPEQQRELLKVLNKGLRKGFGYYFCS